MPDILNKNGLTTKDINEIIDFIVEGDENTPGLKEIYGSDINIESNSPDGQVVNLIAQVGVEHRELNTEVYNSLDPDKATGVVLDQRVSYNNINRKGGTYTIQPIDLVISSSVTLQGLDAVFNDPNGTGYTIADDEGNQFILIDSITLAAGNHTVNFRARNIGQVETTVGTITNQVTVVLGVDSVTNSSGALEIGKYEETDAELRVRRSKSVANNSQGYLDGLVGTILNIDGVTDAKGYENDTKVTDANGIPANSIWIIVEGGANSDIADAIYSKKTPGTGMRGDVVVNITTISGYVRPIKFDRPEAKDLYIRFEIQETVAGTVFDEDAIKDYIVENLTYNIGDFADTSQVTCVAKDAIIANGGGGVPINAEVSDDGVIWGDFLEVANLNEQWTLDSSRITILGLST